jgi:hypothetical protein
VTRSYVRLDTLRLSGDVGDNEDTLSLGEVL